MVSAVSLICILLGAALAYAASRVPAHVELFEKCGGILLVAGLALLGGALSQFL
jgi:hypothetical protein